MQYNLYYGFLAENSKFGEECEKHGIKLIGPSGDVINQMGDKITSKALMKKPECLSLKVLQKELQILTKLKK